MVEDGAGFGGGRAGRLDARRIIALALVVVVILGPAWRQARAQSEQIGAERTQRASELDEVNTRLSLGTAELKRLEDEVAAIKRDREELSRQAIVAAKAVQQTESDVSASEERLRVLARQDVAIRDVLAGKRDIMAELLAALQRMSRNPPPAILVAPENALQTVRSAIMMGAVLPELREEAEKIVAELQKLQGVRSDIANELNERRRQLFTLTETRTKLDLLTEEKKKQLAASEQTIRLSRQRIEELAREAGSLKDLLARLDNAFEAARKEQEQKEEEARKQAEAAAAAKAAADNANVKPNIGEQPPEKKVAALPSGRLPPGGIPFEQARGRLALPASGQILRRYGDDDGVGGTSKGVFIKTRAGATVTSPADGWVVYAGAFRAYGQVIIVNVGNGHHILLAGMERITVEPGQFVLAGESIAQMGETVLATAAALDLNSSRPVLYIEFRKDGATVDPAPWWVSSSEKARG